MLLNFKTIYNLALSVGDVTAPGDQTAKDALGRTVSRRRASLEIRLGECLSSYTI